MNHSTNVTTTIENATATQNASRGFPGVHAPRAAETSAQGATNIDKPASIAPPAFERNARSQCPRVACAQDVVMPHEGQRIRNKVSMVQGGNPSCRCVPNPWGLGSRRRAVTSGASNANPSAARASRLLFAESAEPFECTGVVSIAGRGPENSDWKNRGQGQNPAPHFPRAIHRRQGSIPAISRPASRGPVFEPKRFSLGPWRLPAKSRNPRGRSWFGHEPRSERG